MIRLSPRRLAALFTLAILPACQGSPDHVKVTEVRTDVSRQQFDALPHSRHLGEHSEAIGGMQGVMVGVTVQLSGRKGHRVPLEYDLHDARDDRLWGGRYTFLAPDAEEWTRTGPVWLPLPAPGTYYVRFTLNDSLGRVVSDPRTQDFTIPSPR